MTVREFCSAASLTAVTLPDGEREINGVYVGDLLSWVMGRAEEDQLWLTIMTNSNVIAVASLINVSAVLLAENVELDEKTLSLATEKGINVLSSEKSVYELCVTAGKLL